MRGENKAFLDIHGRKILDRIIGALDGFFDETMIISNTPLLYSDYNLPVYSDLFPQRCSLNGVYSAMSYSMSQHVFVVPCDLPFLDKAMVRLLLDELEGGTDVLIPQTSKGLEPLCAIYSKRCVKPAKRLLTGNNFSVRGFYPDVCVKKVPESKLRQADPELKSFFNVNTATDLSTAITKDN